MTAGVAVHVIASGSAIDGTLFRHAASGTVLGYSVTPLSAWFLMVLGLIAVPVALYSAGYFAQAVAGPRTAAVGVAFNAMPGGIEVVFVADGVIAFLCGWEVMTLATAAFVATEHESRQSRRAAYLFLVMSHVGTGCLMAGFLDPGVCGRFVVVPGDSVRLCGVGTDAQWGVRAVLHRVWCEGRPHPFSRVAPRGPPRGTQQRVRLYVGGAHHGGYLRSLQSVRVWSRHAGCELGARAHVGRDTVCHSRRVVHADAERSSAAGVQPD